MKEQYIVICIKELNTYTQTTRKRFTYQEAIEYASGVAPDRDPHIVPVKPVELDVNSYPRNDA